MSKKRELEENLKLTNTGEAFLDATKSNTAKVAIIGGIGKGRPNFTTLANMIANGEDIKIEIKGDLK
ncbi:hypothetical protein [Pseudobutyrivibrio sp.]